METRTRFKEDCDIELHEVIEQHAGQLVGNQDSLQRGLRPVPTSTWGARRGKLGWKPGLASKRIATPNLGVGGDSQFSEVGNQDSLQRGLRRNDPNASHIAPPFGWKPGLASKRIARLGMPLLGADLGLKRR